MSDLEYRLTLKDLFSKKIDSATQSVSRLDTKMSSGLAKRSSMGALLGGALVVGAVVGFGKAVVESLSKYQVFSASLKVLMYGNAEKAKALEGQLVALAKTTPFSLEDVQTGTKQLMAYGFQAGSIVNNMKMLGDISSGVGAPLGDIVYLYGTLKTQGRAFQRDILQFTGRGIPIIRELAKQFKVTEKEVTELVSKGKVGFKEIEQAFKSMTSSGGQFFGMMAEQSKTVGGQISNLGDNYEQLKVAIGQSQQGILSSSLVFLNELLGGWSTYFQNRNKMEENFDAKKTNVLGQEVASAKQFTTGEKAFELLTNNPIVNAFLNEDVKRSIENVFGGGGRTGAIRQQEEVMQFVNSLTDIKTVEQGRLNRTALQRKIYEIKGKGDRVNALGGITKGKYSADYVSRTVANLEGGIKKINGQVDLLTEKKIKPIETKIIEKPKKDAKIGSPTEYNGARPQNITINLDRLGDVSITAATVTEGANESREIFSKYLLEVLNDANLMARR
jgi:hypothetical protein